MAHPAGTTVFVHYTGTLDDGTEFDSTRGKEPLEITLGEGMVIEGFEKAVRDLEPGQSVTVTIPEEEAYGSYNDELLLPIPKASFPQDIPANPGEQLILRSPEGQEFPAAIVEIREEEILLDANHPLAGLALTFVIEMIAANAPA